MPTPKGQSVPERGQSFINAKRNKILRKHYEMLRTVKGYNQQNVMVGFKELCKQYDPHEVSKFIGEAETWGMIISELGETETHHAGMCLTVTSVGDCFLDWYNQENET